MMTPEANRIYQRGYRRNNKAKIKEHKQRADRRDPWKRLIVAAKTRCRLADIPFNLTFEWGEGRYTGRCEITNIPFISNVGRGRASPFSMSIDRIEPEAGYLQNNCRFVLLGVNCLKGNGTDDDMWRIAQAMINQRHKNLQTKSLGSL